MKITSSSNEKIKEIKKLIKSSKKRNSDGVYLVEGIRMFREIPKSSIREIYISESSVEKFNNDIDGLPVEIVEVSDNVFNGMSDTNTPQGIMAVVDMKKNSMDDICGDSQNPFILIVERLQDPGNLGTIIRTAEGAGVTGIIMSRDTVDVYSPKVVRSTMGSIFRVPMLVSDDLIKDISYLKQRGIKIFGAHLKGEDFYRKDLKQSCAFLIGNEGNGLSEEISNMADDLIKIPMEGKVESLNAAISMAVISYEVLRQRSI